MPDLLGLLPFFGRQNPWTDPAQGGGPDPNEIMPAPNRMTIGGLPVTPLLGGLAAALATRALAGKNYDKNLSTIQGFMLGQRAFSQPIAQEEQQRQQLMRDMINKGWFTPFGGAPTATPGPTWTEGQDLNVPAVAPPAAPMPAATPAQRYINMNGMRLNVAPSASLADLLPGMKLPESVGGAQLPISAEVVNLAAEQAKEQAARNYYTRRGHPADMPIDVAKSEEETQRKIAAFNEFMKTRGAPDEYTQEQIEMGPGGVPVVRRTTASVAEQKRLDAQQAWEREEQMAQRLQRGKELEFQTERLNQLKNKVDQLTPQEMGAVLDASRLKLSSLANRLKDLPVDALGQPTPASGPARAAIEAEMDATNQEISTLTEAYKKKIGLETPAPAAPENPQTKAFNTKLGQNVTSLKTAFSSGKKKLSLAAMDSFGPEPKDSQDKEAFQQARNLIITEVTPLVEQIREHMQGRTGFFGAGMDPTFENYMAGQYPDWWPLAKRAWEAER